MNVPAERYTEQHLLQVRHWTDTLLSARTSRDAAYRFKPGHYARVGLSKSDGEIVWRPLSVVSSPAEDALEFYVILVPGGEFSTLLQTRQAGDTVLIDRNAFGFMTLDQLAPGRDLWLIASGTGLGPFVSILRDPAVWSRFERIYLVHSVRRAAELSYADEILPMQTGSASGGARLQYLPVVTREAHGPLPATRVPELLLSGELERVAGAAIDAEQSRVMVCGNPGLTAELRRLLAERGMLPGRRGNLGQVALEQYWST